MESSVRVQLEEDLLSKLYSVDEINLIIQNMDKTDYRHIEVLVNCHRFIDLSTILFEIDTCKNASNDNYCVLRELKLINSLDCYPPINSYELKLQYSNGNIATRYVTRAPSQVEKKLIARRSIPIH